jgi:ubiquinone biosynthesis protein Coq4
MGIYATIKKGRSALLVYLTHQLALPLLRLIRKPVKFPYTIHELRDFPAGTLGNDLQQFLDKRGLQLLSYYAKHDIKHIILDYDTTDEGEGCLQFFMLGNRHLSIPVLATVLYALCTMPEHHRSFKVAYRRGKRTCPLQNLDWAGLLIENTEHLKKKIL